MQEIRIAILGNVDSGKSTLVSTVTYKINDDGRGSAREKVFKHKHEKETGRTSDISYRYMKIIYVEFFGYFAAILTTLAFIPQLIKTLKTKKAEDVSLTTLIMFLTGVAAWIIYGIQISSKPILIANIITFVLNFLILVFKLIYSKE